MAVITYQLLQERQEENPCTVRFSAAGHGKGEIQVKNEREGCYRPAEDLQKIFWSCRGNFHVSFCLLLTLHFVPWLISTIFYY